MVKTKSKKKAVALIQFKKGDIIFAKVKGFPFWPSVAEDVMVSSIKARFNDPSNTWAKVSFDMVRPFTMSMCDELSSKHAKNHRLLKCIEEMKWNVAQMQKRVKDVRNLKTTRATTTHLNRTLRSNSDPPSGIESSNENDCFRVSENPNRSR